MKRISETKEAKAMMKKEHKRLKTLSILDGTIAKIESLSSETGLTQGAILDRSISLIYDDEKLKKKLQEYNKTA